MSLALVLAVAGALPGQAPRPAFEAASIKPNPGCQVTGAGGITAGRVELPCVTLRGLVRTAYGGFTGEKLAARRIEVAGGPGWLDSDPFSLSAKAEGDPPVGTMLGPMLQSLLEERFHLKVHREDRNAPVYALTVAKGGPKLKPAKEGGCVEMDLKNMGKPDFSKPMPKYCGAPSMTMKDGKTIADVSGSTMEELGGRLLEMLAGRPVVDKTGLTGRFDIHLEFVRDWSVGARPMLNGAPMPELPSSEGGLSIFTALQEQLGLKLVADKSPVPLIVVDAAEKPAEN